MTIKTFTFNPVMENTYVLHDETREAIVIDAGCLYENEKKALQQYLEHNQLILKRVINTHLHFDHQFGNRFLFETYRIGPEAHAADECLLEGVKAKAVIYGFPIHEDAQALKGYLQDNELVTAGNMQLRCIHVPGHAPGHLAFFASEHKVLFSGDILFKNSIGRTDLVFGNHEQLIRGINEKLMTLPPDTVVYPGHGPTTTIGEEHSTNPFL